ncbi:unnamed protein product [Schistosoma mattheei]|uniref:Uncharacterized protein n=1 Tax=Schistosoma mattheei TaxID=31246 RepID=A0A183P8M0_9TREM|nr:unnamed protein product [Schistosoma mattheei]
MEWITVNTLDKIEGRCNKKAAINTSRTRAEKAKAQAEYAEVNKQVKRSIGTDKRKYVEDLATKAEKAAREGNMRQLYDTTKKLSGNHSKPERPVKIKEGEVITNIEEQQNRWVEHFKELLNRSAPLNPPNIEAEPTDHPINVGPPTIKKSAWPSDKSRMQEKTISVAAASAAIGLSIHKGKSKILQYNTACNNPIIIDGDDLEDVKTFTYLGSIIDEQGGCDADVRARIGKAREACPQLKNIWNSKQLSTNTKVRIFNTNVKTVLLYGAETWRTTKAIIHKIQMFINSCLRKILRIRWPDTIDNNVLWERTKPDPSGGRNQEEALEVDRTHIEEGTELRHKTSPHTESSRLKEKRKTKENIAGTMKDVKARRGAEIDSDHHLLVAKIKLMLKKRRKTGETVLQRFNIASLQHIDKLNEFKIALNNRSQAIQELLKKETTVENNWNVVKEALNSTFQQVLGLKEHHHKEWISIKTLKRT